MIDSLIKHLEKTENNIIYYSIIINNNPHVQGLSSRVLKYLKRN